MKLKPCPFCGSDDIDTHDLTGAAIRCHCNNCGALGPDSISEEHAAEMWNLRRPMAEVERQRDELLAACEAMAEYIALIWEEDSKNEPAFMESARAAIANCSAAD